MYKKIKENWKNNLLVKYSDMKVDKKGYYLHYSFWYRRSLKIKSVI